jgi:DNA replication protein DnaC
MNNNRYKIAEAELRNMLIEELSLLFLRDGAKISSYNIPTINRASQNASINSMIDEERSYNILDLIEKSTEMFDKLNCGQLATFNKIVTSVNSNTPSFFFVYGHGGTGKTFLWNTIVCRLRSEKK